MSFTINGDGSKCDVLGKFAPSIRVKESKLNEIFDDNGPDVAPRDTADGDHDGPLWTELDQRICKILFYFRKYYRAIQIPSKIIDKLIETMPSEFQIIPENLPKYQIEVTIVVANFYSAASVANSYSVSRNNASQKLCCAFKRLMNLIENFELIASKKAFPACMEQFIDNNRNMVKITAKKISNNQYQSRFDIWHLRQFCATASDAMEVLLRVANEAFRYLQYFLKQFDPLIEINQKQPLTYSEKFDLEIQKSIPCIELINKFITISRTNSSPVDVVTCLMELDPTKFEFNKRNNKRTLSVVSLGDFGKPAETESEFRAEAFMSVFKHLSGLTEVFNSFKSMYKANCDESAIIETLATQSMVKMTEYPFEDGVYKTAVYIVHLSRFRGRSINRDKAKRIAFSKMIEYLKVTSQLIN